jgi:hypothetical protein
MRYLLFKNTKIRILEPNINKITFQITFIFLLLSSKTTFSQEDNKIFWNSDKKLTAENFKIKTANSETTHSFAQFSIDYSLNGFDFLTKNFNKKVRNYMIPTASWIDTTVNLNQSIIYQQTLFDLCEIYVRKFRKQLVDNKNKILKGISFAEKLNSEILSDFSKRRVKYDKETDYGRNLVIQKEWQLQIQKELIELDDYSYEK